MAPSTDQRPHLSPLQTIGSALDAYFRGASELAQPDARRTSVTILAFVSLFLFWAFRVYSTWATWGSLTIDSGHEAYVPALLAQGKTLYRDVFWMYTPLAPYINSYLFRLFGIHLEVLYWAGSLSAFASALFLFLAGKRLSSSLFGWTAAFALLFEAFHSWHFSFPFPYSFAAVYGCLAACFFLWCSVNALFSNRLAWYFAAASSSAVALMLKPEFGTGCYLSFIVLVAFSAILRRSFRQVLLPLLTMLPGLLACALVVRWMVSLAGVDFITQENIMSWPSAYFMRAYGQLWLAKTGFSLAPATLVGAFGRSVYFFSILFVLLSFAWWKRSDLRFILFRILFLLAVSALAFHFGWTPIRLLGAILFPRDMIFFVCFFCALALWFFFQKPEISRAALAWVLLFSLLLAWRLLFGMFPGGYPIYYNGPVLLAFLLALRLLLHVNIPEPHASRRAELLVACGCILVVALVAVNMSRDRSDLVKFQSDRGSIYVTPQVAANYKAGVNFIRESNRRGFQVLSVPEDVSLYFFSGQEAPSRVFQFSPGVVAPGKMTADVLREIQSKPVQYLLWSNRDYPDYGTTIFGKDYDQTLGNFLTSHYHEIGPLVPNSDIFWEAKFVLWERNSETPSSTVSRSR